MRRVVKREQSFCGEVAHLGFPLPLECLFPLPIMALIEGNDRAYLGWTKLLANSIQTDVREALLLISRVGESDACVRIVQDGVGAGGRPVEHGNFC